jgi:hypothetical protein
MRNDAEKSTADGAEASGSSKGKDGEVVAVWATYKGFSYTKARRAGPQPSHAYNWSIR